MIFSPFLTTKQPEILTSQVVSFLIYSTAVTTVESADDLTALFNVPGYSNPDFSTIPFPLMLAPLVSEHTYNGVLSTNVLTNMPVAAAEVAFAATMVKPSTFAIGNLIRWRQQKEMDYVGEDFNISSPFTAVDATATTVSRFFSCRLRYKYRIDKERIDVNWTQSFTGDNGETLDKIPHGNIRIARIQYNAVEKSITIISLRDGSAVKMRSNAAIWFLIQQLLLIPITVV